jgi:deoxyribonuclease-4
LRIGVHVWISEGLLAAAETARDLGCEAIQIFAANPNAWSSPPIDPEEAQQFVSLLREYDIAPVVVHTGYPINMATPQKQLAGMTRRLIIDSMQRAALLQAEYVVTHIGSHKGTGVEAGVERIIALLKRILDETPPEPTLLLECSAGAGDHVGNTFEEIAMILDGLPDSGDRLAVCLDSAHMWGAGYDLSNKESVDSVFARFDRLIGFDRLKIFHANDTQVALGSRKDRHFDIGEGKIGDAGFMAILSHPAMREIPLLLETPNGDIERDRTNIARIKRLRERALRG